MSNSNSEADLSDDFDEERDSDDMGSEESDNEISSKKRKKDSGKSKKKKKKSRPSGVAAFFDDAARDEDDEEDEYERYSDEDDDPEQDRLRDEIIAEQDRRRKAEGFLDMNRSAEELAQEFEYRHRTQYQSVSIESITSESAGGTGLNNDVSQQSLLPTVGDAKMWVMKCKTGYEKLLVLSIMNKAFTLSQQGKKFGIRSAVVGSAKGFIYIEADSEPECRSAIRGFRLMLHYTMKLVPIKDMTTIMTVKRRKTPIKPGDWVRMKRGVYKGDLAQATEVLESGTKVIVKVVPRLDLTVLRLPPDEARLRRKQQPARPQQKFFNYTEVRNAGGDVQRKRMSGSASWYDFFQNNFYLNGFMIKELSDHAVSAENVLPTIEELQRFQERKDADDGYGSDESETSSRFGVGKARNLDELTQIVQASSKEKLVLIKGDQVKVTEGELKGLLGKVVDASGVSIIKVAISSEELLGQILDFQPTQLVKFIKVGAHAKVVDGRYTGETGTIVSMVEAEGDFVAALLTDRSSKEIQVRVAQLQETSEIAVGLDSLRGYELYDLVQLGHAEVGVVVHVGSQELKILNNNGVARNYRPEEVHGKRNFSSLKAIALDARQSQIRVGDMVKILEGAYNGKSATVKHIHRAILFVHEKKVQQNSGVFVVRARSCTSAGSQVGKTNVLAPTFAQQSTQQQEPPSRPAVVGNRGRVKDDLITKSVKITKGPMKGYLGTIIDTTDTHVKVEVHTKAKKVMLLRNQVKVVGDELGSIDRDRTSSYATADIPVTPFLMATTPMHAGGSQTPMYSGMMTPMHDGSQTPTHMPYTPSHSSDVWRPGAMDTPMHSDRGGWEDDAFNPRTPGSATRDAFMPGSADRTPPPGSGNRHSDSRFSVQSWHPQGGSSSERSEMGTPTFEAPITPNSADERSEGAWVAEGVIVEILDKGVFGEIVTIIGDTVKVQTENGELQNLRVSDIRPAVPEKKDRVRVISGQDAGLEGVLVGVDSQDGILKDANNEFKFVEMVSLVKIRA